MGGGAKKKRQQAAEDASRKAAETERANAARLQTELDQRRALITPNLSNNIQTTRTGAVDIATTGGYDPTQVRNTPTYTPRDIPTYTNPGEIDAFDPSKVDISNRGFEGYEDLSRTGGFSPIEKDNFLRRALSPVSAMYSRVKDELARRGAIQGGYSPGFTASNARFLRQEAIAGSEASLGANVNLSNQIRTGKELGLAGMGRVRDEAGREALTARGQNIDARGQIIDANAIARGQDITARGQEIDSNTTARQQDINQQNAISGGRVAGQDLLQKYNELGVSALSDVDVNDLRNRLQSGQMSQADAQLLTQLAAQDKTLFEKIMQGVGVAAGAVAGVAGAVSPT